MSNETKNELSNVERPSYLSRDGVIPVDNSDMSQYSKPPRIKIIQSQTGSPLKPQFKDGDAVLIPQCKKVGDLETAFSFVSISFFTNWICMNPIEMKAMLPSIRGFTFDPDNEIAKLAKKFVRVKCPENQDYFLRYRETLNFFIILEDDEELRDIPIHIFFSSGEYATGQKLIGMIQARKAPRYACRFRAVPSIHTGKKGTWYGMDIMNDPTPYVSEENFFKYQKLYTDLKELIDSRTLDLDLQDAEESIAGTDAAKTEF